MVKKIIKEDYQRAFIHERPESEDTAPRSRESDQEENKKITEFEVTGVFLIKGGKHAKGCGIKRVYRK